MLTITLHAEQAIVSGMRGLIEETRWDIHLVLENKFRSPSKPGIGRSGQGADQTTGRVCIIIFG